MSSVCITRCLVVSLVLGRVAFAQSTEEGIPVTDPLVIAKCGACHPRDEHGNMQRISWERTTPEGWQEALKRMIVVNGVTLTPLEARAMVKYLSTDHGLAPEEARPVMYDAERRIQRETNIPNERVEHACARCHTFARVLKWRRSNDDWKQLAQEHAARYKLPANDEAIAFLAKAAPLHTPEWEAWGARTHTPDPSGRWLVNAYLPGHGKYYGDMQVHPTPEGDFTMSVRLTSVNDGTRFIRTGRSVVYAGYAWRGRSQGPQIGGLVPNDPLSEAREVLRISPDGSTAEGRWFWDSIRSSAST